MAALDLGVSIAWATASLHPERVACLTVLKGLLGTLPGAEGSLAAGPPWWFGFHATSGLPEALVDGHVEEYLDFFLSLGAYRHQGVSDNARDAYVAAYSNPESPRCGFDHYRQLRSNGQRTAELAGDEPVSCPVLAISGGQVGDTPHGQLEAITPRLCEESVGNARHIVPQDVPGALAHHIRQQVASPS